MWSDTGTGERQKIRMSELENLRCQLLGREHDATQQAQVPSTGLRSPATSHRSSSTTLPLDPDRESGPGPRHLDTLSLLSDHAIALDDGLKELITEGRVSLSDILRAGVTALQLTASALEAFPCD
jgi:hypothetical protein